ncbi:MAG: prephenate dehydrogenase/arogenate dehydrogenase family protein [Ferrovum sp.]|nr:prephenate dehydrogenase/arogenate dehydrogenase family protein [Ferrovum sp.]NDU87202.1 prephenate dehydrogenase/arogenate dehydrogenase family protein [Ferrovum sp.]
MPRRIAILGVGLIGGSFALALRQAVPDVFIVGYDRDEVNLAAARQLGVIDRGTAALAQAVQEADLILMAVPVGQMPLLFEQMRPHLNPAAVITDVGSTKVTLVEMARAHLGEAITRFVPGHPIAGAELSGVRAAHPDLFRERTVVLTPLAETSSMSYEWVCRCWESCGAKVEQQTVERHDEIFGIVSHLPHLLSFSLVHDIAVRDDAATLFRHAAGGFRDFTRIAGSNAEMWRDISLANRTVLMAELTRYQDQLTQLSQWLEERDGAALEEFFKRARDARRRWQEER